MRKTPLGCTILEGHDVADLPLVSENSEILELELAKKVPIVAGKGLSTNDYTTAEKTKLAGIAAGANNYVHPAGTNPHNTTKSDVGLSSVLNYGVATKAEAEAGTSNAKYMTPLRVQEAIESLAVSKTVPIVEATVGSYGTATSALQGTSPNLPSFFLSTIGYDKFVVKLTDITPIVYIHCEWFTNDSRRVLSLMEDSSLGSSVYSFNLNNTDKRIIELGSTMVITGSFVVSGTNTSISLPKIPKYVSIAYLDTAGAGVKKGTIIEKFSSMGSYSFRHLEEAAVGAAHTMLLNDVFDFKFTSSGFTVESSSVHTGRTAYYIAIL